MSEKREARQATFANLSLAWKTVTYVRANHVADRKMPTMDRQTRYTLQITFAMTKVVASAILILQTINSRTANSDSLIWLLALVALLAISGPVRHFLQLNYIEKRRRMAPPKQLTTHLSV
jgi:hypothetical protein